MTAATQLTDGTTDLIARRLGNGYELRVRLTITSPPSGSLGCAARVLFDAADTGSCYAFTLRERTGVRYASLLRIDNGVQETLLEVILGFGFDVSVDIRLVVDGARISAYVDDQLVGAVNDVHRLRHDAIGFCVDGTAAAVDDVQLHRLHDDPLPTVSPVVFDTPKPIRHSAGPSIGNETYRIDFGAAHHPDGDGITARLSTVDGHVVGGLDDWCLLTGDFGRPDDPYGTLSGRRVRFTDVEPHDEHSATLTAAVPGLATVTVTWSLQHSRPQALVSVTAAATGRYVMAFHGFKPYDDVDEVLCGPLRHARIVGGPEPVGAGELTTPACLVEADDWTVGLFIPADELTLADEMVKNPEDQPFGMTLRGPTGVQPSVFLPQYGTRADLEAGQTAQYRVGCYAAPVRLHEAYRELLREEYGYRAYRRNVCGASLTDTVHNLIDLLAAEPQADDSEQFQPSPSGWWSRAKGFIDIENDQAVRATTTSVLLSAAYLTGDAPLYERRARPTVEYHLSRNSYGWTPRVGYDVYGDAGKNRLCATPFGVTALGPLHAMTRRQSPGIAALALRDVGAEQDYWLRRAPMCAPLAAYRLTADATYLQRAQALADEYIATRIDTPATEPLDPHDFAIYYCADWVGLFELYEATQQRRYLEAAVREARRFVTQLFVRPVHNGHTTVPDRDQIHDRQIELARWWGSEALFDYPKTEIGRQQVEAWVLSLTGMGFEALQTYRYSGAAMNPCWAPHLLRLAHRAHDDLLADIAHNAAVGRFTNYPGYYYRQHTAHHMEPDFPFIGPFDNTTIYYHHAPAQLGMTIDYLFAEHETRSDGQICFPAAFEENFVWFRHRVYGHRPGRFYGTDNVWPWLPRGIISVDNPALNWLAGHCDDRLLLSLTNSSEATQRARVRIALDTGNHVELLHGAGARLEHGALEIEVAGHGVTAVAIPNTRIPDVPMHRDPEPVEDSGDSYRFDDDTAVGAVRGVLLARPDAAGTDAYVQSTCTVPATLAYSLDDGQTWRHEPKVVHPAEWTVPVPHGRIRYRVADAAGVSCEPVDLRAPT